MKEILLGLLTLWTITEFVPNVKIVFFFRYLNKFLKDFYYTLELAGVFVSFLVLSVILFLSSDFIYCYTASSLFLVYLLENTCLLGYFNRLVIAGLKFFQKLFPLIYLSLFLGYLFGIDSGNTFENPLLYPSAFFYTTLIYFTLLTFLKLAFNRNLLSHFIVSTLFLFLTIVSKIKIQTLGQPFFIEDFNVWKEFLFVGSQYLSIYPTFVLSLLIWTLVLIVLLLFENQSVHRTRSILLRQISFLFIMVLFFGENNRFLKFNGYLGPLSVNLYSWSTELRFKNNKTILNAWLTYLNNKLPSPSLQEKQALDFLSKRYLDLKENDNTIFTRQNQPDVILILSESFWDPTVLKTVPFNKNPMESVKDLWSQNEHSTMISSVFGGGTANAEFSVLTGLKYSFFPKHSVPYMSFINNDISTALPHRFAQAHYETYSIHPYYGWFWNRNKVHQKLGFQNSIFIEDMNDIKYQGPYASDDFLSDQIINLLNKNNEPKFIFAISMQNHGPYSNKRYDQEDSIVMNPQDSKELYTLNNYSIGVQDASRAYLKLINSIAKFKKDTIVIMFGDHLPILDKENSFYKSNRIKRNHPFEDNTLTKQEQFRVPVLCWSNYFKCKFKYSNHSLFFLYEDIVSLSQLPKTNFDYFLEDYGNKIKVDHPNFKITSNSDLELPEELIQFYDFIIYGTINKYKKLTHWLVDL